MAEDSTLRDQLAIDRTRLANERTMLAWVRTGIGLVGGGVAIAHFYPAGWQVVAGGALGALGALTLVIGLARYRAVGARLSDLARPR